MLRDQREQQREREREREIETAEPRQPAASGWMEIKSRFVDDPAGALAAADELVRQAIEERMRRMKEEYEELRRADGGDANATEGLRNRLIRYHAYYERLSGRPTH